MNTDIATMQRNALLRIFKQARKVSGEIWLREGNYQYYKSQIYDLGLPPLDYDAAIKQLADILGIKGV